jgi:hypothetical protein
MANPKCLALGFDAGYQMPDAGLNLILGVEASNSGSA